MRLQSLPFILVFLANGALADCPEKYESSGKLNMQQRSYKGFCNASVSYNENGLGRSFWAGSDGSLKVFVTFGKGSNSKSTGSRDYFFFPRFESPAFKKLTDGDVDLRLSAGQIVRISSKSGEVKLVSGAKTSDDPKISGKNRGGLEVSSYDGILLDCGWGVGDPGYVDNAACEFRDPEGQFCSVPTSAIFKKEAGGEVKFVFDSDAKLAGFLEKRCPKLDIRRLRRQAPSGVSSPASPSRGARAQ